MKRILSGMTIVVLAAMLLANSTAAQQKQEKSNPAFVPAADDKPEVTFEKNIKPIFQKACVECHGPQKSKGGARFDTREATLKGGKHGGRIVVGDSAKSTLIKDMVSSDKGGPWMPPQKKSKFAPLTKEEIELVKAWIDQGAKE